MFGSRPILFLLIAFLLTQRSNADVESEQDADSEFDDVLLEAENEMKELDSIPDWSLPILHELSSESSTGDEDENQEIASEDQEKMRKHRLEEELRDLLSKLLNKDQSLPDAKIENVEGIPPDADDHHEVEKRSLNRGSIRWLIWDILKGSKKRKAVHTATGKFPRKCSKFHKPLGNSTVTSCGSATTPLGPIEWCHVTCREGYMWKGSSPQFELCGAATKHRWSYQLRGLKRPEERCLSGSTNQTIDVCLTPECLATAAYYMNRIDFSVNPCNDFYKFACGRWMSETSIPPADGKYSTYTIIRDRVHRELSQLLMEPINATECEAVAKAKTAYRACLNEELIERLDSQPLLDMLRGDMAWPILDEFWDPDDFNFESTVASLRGKLSNKVVLDAKMGKHKGKRYLMTLKGTMSIPFKFYIDSRYDDRLRAYYDLMYDVAIMLGADPQVARNDVINVRRLEHKLATHKYSDNDVIVEKSIAEMNRDIPGIDWLDLFKRMITSHPVNSSTQILVWDEEYLTHLSNLVQNTDRRTLQNYLVWTNVKRRIQSLSSRFQQRYLEFEETLFGKRALTSRRERCAMDTMYLMKGPTGKLYIETYFSEAKKKVAEELFDFIRKGFLHLLDNEVTWMDNKTKAYARLKALGVKRDIGYNPRIYKNATYLDQHYKNVVIDPNDYFNNVISLLTNQAQKEFRLMGGLYNPQVEPFNIRPTMVNALNNLEHNVMMLPAGEMQYPFYWGNKFPAMFQFGAIGTILGHELTHSFDNNGRKRGIDGELLSWWTPSSLDRFKKRVKCMEEQYDRYYFEPAGENLNGKKDLAENIADNGGIRESYAGYHLWLKAHNKTSERLEPASGFTNDQLFFIGFATARCALYKPEAAIHDLAANVHSPGRFRVIGSLQNFDKFSKAFDCPVGSFMNPRHKCVIW
ncbi:phosphate-regulating neutral endopeptidase PHEX-like [Clavelina lepadiformis]|uniref:phosphate-regulating neutral endopeptidase PHEX-like n=1 Tax=Clavelina lepadiformis TaxID=159417 RepID=UPI004041C3D9